MEEVFEEVLALCLDRVVDGDSPAACAADFPDYPDLLPLLEFAGGLSALPRSEPSPPWRLPPRDDVARFPARRADAAAE